MRTAIVVFAAVVALAGCTDKKKEQAIEAQHAADSMTALRRTGATDLNNPEMGSKVLVSVLDDSVVLSHKEIPHGQATFAVVNNGKTRRQVEIEGKGGTWRTFALRPKETVLVAMVLDTGMYDVFVIDSVKGKDVAKQHIKVTSAKMQ